MNGHNSRFAQTTWRRRYSRGHLGCMAAPRDTRAPRREELFKETGRIIAGRFAVDYSTEPRAGEDTRGASGTKSMIIDAFIKLFNKKHESSMQDRAEESRRQEVDQAEQEFYEQQDRLKTVLRQISGGKND